jgi:hypothetical protein
VTIDGPEPQLIHSKITRGQGRCETEEELDAVLDAIEAHMQSSKAQPSEGSPATS